MHIPFKGAKNRVRWRMDKSKKMKRAGRRVQRNKKATFGNNNCHFGLFSFKFDKVDILTHYPMNSKFKRFDMSRPPIRTRWYLWPLTLALSLPSVISHKAKIRKIGMEGIKPPCVLLCNHNSFLYFKVATKAIFPYRANYVVAIDGFIGRKWLL